MDPVRRYVIGIGLAGVGAAAAFVLSSSPRSEVEASFWLLVGLSLASVLLPVRFQRSGGAQGFTLETGVFVALLLSSSVSLVPVALVAASLVGHGLRSRDLRKIVFNAGRVGLETTAGAAAFLAVAPAGIDAGDLRSVGAAVLAVFVVELVSITCMSELFRRLEGLPRITAFREVSMLSVLTGLGNVAYGIVLGFVVTRSLLVTILSGVMMLGLYFGYRGYASAVSREHYSERLNELTRSMLDIADESGFHGFLSRLMEVFGAAEGALVLRYPRDVTIYHHSQPERSGSEPPRELTHLIARVGVLTGVTFDRDSEGDVERLAVALQRGELAIGAVALSGRRGFEPWEEADGDLLAAVANELSVALQNVELFEEVERERARLEAESTKLADVLGAASDGIALIAGDGTIQTWNPGMTKITGVDADQAVGQPWFVVMRLRDDAGEEIMPDNGHQVARALRGERLDHPILLQGMRRDGRWRWLQCTVSPVAGQEEPIGSVLVARDVTAEHEVDELKSDFIATVSHELRTPLTPLKGFLTTLRRTGGELHTESLDRVFQAMSNQVNRLEALISDLLAVAELDSGQFDLHPEIVDMADHVQAAAEVEAGPTASDRLRVEVRQQVASIADPLAVTRIVRALVSNAIKHTDGPVTVQVDADEEHAVVRVIDAGPGIPPWEQSRIFGRFERLGDHLQRTQGPGLGLTIARALAHRMQGDLTIQSDVGSGSTFTLSLPLARRPRLRLAASE